MRVDDIKSPSRNKQKVSQRLIDSEIKRLKALLRQELDPKVIKKMGKGNSELPIRKKVRVKITNELPSQNHRRFLKKGTSSRKNTHQQTHALYR